MKCQRGYCDIDPRDKEISRVETVEHWDGMCNDIGCGYRRPHCATCNCNAGNGCKGNPSNGVKWYRVKGDPGTWGFANENSTINLWNTDVYRDQFDDNAKDNNKDNQRLSLNVGQGSFQGASRCGNKVASFNHGEKCEAGKDCTFSKALEDNGDWKLVFYHATFQT